MSDEKKPAITEQVILQTKDHAKVDKDAKARQKTFSHEHALKLLTRPNSQWELPTDSKFKFNGQDLSVKEKEK